MKIRKSISQWIRNEAGDTLIEVTIALSILSMVLLSTTVVATRAYQLGQTARERTSMVAAARTQMEQIRGFRDNNTWEHFLNGDTAGGQYLGVMIAAAPAPAEGEGESDPTNDDDGPDHHHHYNYDHGDRHSFSIGETPQDCQIVTPCMHMSKSEGEGIATPKHEGVVGSLDDSYIETKIIPNSNIAPTEVDIVIYYGAAALGGGSDNIGHIKTKLTNIGRVVATPAPLVAIPTPLPAYGDGEAIIDPGVCGSPGLPDCGGAPASGHYRYDALYSNLSNNDPANIDHCAWDWGDGVIQTYAGTNGACLYGGSSGIHTYAKLSPEPPYPTACWQEPGSAALNKVYTTTFTVYLKNAAPKSDSRVHAVPDCW